jgi:REP-associated tyrosine transposase
VFHVYTHCVWEGRGYVRDDLDRQMFLRELARATSKFEWTCVGFCLLGSHYHLLLGVPDGALSRGMQSLNWRYAVQFNARHGLRGHLQFDRFGSRRISDDPDLVSAYRYVMRNPVDAGLAPGVEAWPWSSHAGTIGLIEPHSFVDASLVLGFFGGSREASMSRLRAFVAES